METTELTPRQVKDQFIQNLTKKIKDRITPDNLVTKISTCNYSGWDEKEHLYMPEVSQRLISEGYTVNRSINYGVVDYVIAL